MCNHHVPDYSYREQHISCCECKTNYANLFVITDWIPSNYEQAIALSKMTADKMESYAEVDAKGNKQYYSKIVETSTPWFAQNTSEVPLLKPICNNCFNLEINKLKTISCSHGFELFKLQKSRFNSGSPYLPWIEKDLKEIMNKNNI